MHNIPGLELPFAGASGCIQAIDVAVATAEVNSAIPDGRL